MSELSPNHENANHGEEGFDVFHYSDDEEHEHDGDVEEQKESSSPSNLIKNNQRPPSNKSSKILPQFSSRPQTNSQVTYMEKFEVEKSDYNNENVPVDDRVRLLVNNQKNNQPASSAMNESFGESFDDSFHEDKDEIEEEEKPNVASVDTSVHASDSQQVQDLKKRIKHDEKVIAKLKKSNQNLKEQLFQLNQIVDEQLIQKGVDVPKPKPTVKTVLVGNEQELKVLRKQHEIDKKTIERLQKQLFNEGNPERIKSLENKVKELKQQLDEVREENKSLKVIQREQSKALENTGVQDKAMDLMKNESKFLNAKIEKLREKCKELEELVNQKNKMLSVYEQKAKNLDTILRRKNLSEDGVAKIDELSKQVEELNQTNDKLSKEVVVLKRARETIEKKAKMIAYQSKQDVKKFSQENSELRNALEKRDKDIRSLNMTLKQNKLEQYMINVSPIPTPTNSSSSSSTADSNLFSATPNTVSNAPGSSSSSNNTNNKKSAVSSPSHPPKQPITKPSATKANTTNTTTIQEHKKGVTKKNNIQTLGENRKVPSPQPITTQSSNDIRQEQSNPTTVEEDVGDDLDDFDDFENEMEDTDQQAVIEQDTKLNEDANIFAPSF
ncbi:hypothetical protein FDP41_005474 [Naegleria fowleri]|uniref:Lebercilin domain-containing protein n=1 Tax=Naegleria fowleri TaxID=5763 RepID=A0A6A5BND6_NAEFO|nr:uncharacterized protein FDP41_005474 [Naegleria fowleri]KAF0975480.1 hypothetical protein FDP41_005474 [Naegleria fowleri]CAG4716861.1 unnamed protein product [Naegleria fowleri]